MPAAAMLCFVLAAAPVTPKPPEKPPEPQAAVAAVLDGWHRAAARADEEAYFRAFTPDAVFLGTDATERWTRDAFRAWAHPFFARGKAWDFHATSRHVAFSPDGAVAWFDEALDTPNLGPARGSGVLVKQGGDWKIAQYNLSVPIPNDVMKDVKARIDAYAREKDGGR